MHNHLLNNNEGILFTVFQDDLARRKINGGPIGVNYTLDSVSDILTSDQGWILILGVGLVFTLLATLLLLLRKRYKSGGGSRNDEADTDKAGTCPNCPTGRNSDYIYGNKATTIDSESGHNFSISNKTRKGKSITKTNNDISSNVDHCEECSTDSKKGAEGNDCEIEDSEGQKEFVSTRSSDVIKSRWRNSFYRACRLNFDDRCIKKTDDDISKIDVVPSDDQEPEFLKSRTLRANDVQIPIETSNDSNTSEYDDTWYDSRQEDTSALDVGQLQEQNETAFDTNEAVLDADLRKANRSNLEMAMMMNQRNNQAFESNLTCRNSGRMSRSRSLTSAFSQTGVLPVASLIEAEQQYALSMMRQQDLESVQNSASLPRASVSSDQGSSDSQTTDTGCSYMVRHQSALAMDQHSATVRIVVRRLKVAAPDTCEFEDPNRFQTKNAISSIADKLANKAKFAASRAIYSMGSKDLSDTEAESHASANYFYEIELIESKNLRHQQTSSIRSQGNNLATSTNDTPPRSTGRRESLMNVLMPSSAHRRSSLEGVFARVFKSQQSVVLQRQQSSSASLTTSTSKQPSSSAVSLDSDTYSMTSTSTSNSIWDLGCGSEYIQSPVCRLKNGYVKFEPNSMRLICHKHEFPLRVSLYQVDKKGSRYTIGHCFVLLEDWVKDFGGDFRKSQSSESSDCLSDESRRKDSQSDDQVGSSSRSSVLNELRRRSSSSAGDLYQKIRSTIAERPSQDVRVIDFKLYQTIFDAIK